MANVHTTLVSLFDDIADAIRYKTGGTELIIADTFPDEIRAIPTGSGERSPRALYLGTCLLYEYEFSWPCTATDVTP